MLDCFIAIAFSLFSGPTKYEDELVGGEGWGKKKKYFYGGNPIERQPHKEDKEGDDEEEDEAEIEARESKKLQERQLADMDEEDFLEAFATTATGSREDVKVEL